MIRVLIVEDEAIIAQSIKHFLGNINYQVVGMAHNSTKALDLLALRSPDVVLLDISIKGTLDGIELAEIINRKYSIPFIYLTSHADSHTVDRAKKTIPSGYIVKPFDERDLLTSIEMAVYRHAQQNTGPVPTIEKVNEKLPLPITSKEFEVLCDVCEGLTNQQLAKKHFLSINTIKYHMKKILSKLEVTNRSGAIVKMREM